MKRAARLIVPILVIATLAAFAVRQMRISQTEQGIHTGLIEADQSNVGSTVSGRVTRIYIREGDWVTRGQRLWQFESDELEASLEGSRAAERQSEQALADLLAGTRPETVQQAVAAASQARNQLARLRNGSRKEEVQQAAAVLEQAKARLKLLETGPREEQKRIARANLQAAEAESANARQNLHRADELFESGAISRQARDDSERLASVSEARAKAASLALEEAEAGTRPEEIRAAREAVAAARAGYELLRNGARSEDIRAAEAVVRQAEAKVAELRAGARPHQISQARAGVSASKARTRQLESRLRERAVYAPIDGQVLSLSAQPGDLVQPGSAAAVIVDPRSLFARLYLPESVVRSHQVGDSILLETDEGTEVAATIEQIPFTPEYTPRNVQTRDERALEVYAVKVRIPNPDNKLRAGMSVTFRAVK